MLVHESTRDTFVNFIYKERRAVTEVLGMKKRAGVRNHCTKLVIFGVQEMIGNAV